jgi:hypothetical protein
MPHHKLIFNVKEVKKARREQKVKDLEDMDLHLKSEYVRTDPPTKRNTRAWKRLVRQSLNTKKR